MKTFYHYLTRKQVIVIWTDETGKHSQNYSRNDRGHRAANAKIARLDASGYKQEDAPAGWFEALIDAAIKEREAQS